MDLNEDGEAVHNASDTYSVKQEHVDTVYLLDTKAQGDVPDDESIVTTVVIAPGGMESGANCTITTQDMTTDLGVVQELSTEDHIEYTTEDAPFSPGGGKMKRRSSTKEERLCCLVCGDKALGCNFDAISCESCKAFFRRNALKEKMTNCLFEGHCKIDINTRRFCPSCRLQKCFTVGMKKQFILGDDEKKKRMQKVMQNRAKKVKKEEPGGDKESRASSPSLSQPSTPAPELITPPPSNVSARSTTTSPKPVLEQHIEPPQKQQKIEQIQQSIVISPNQQDSQTTEQQEKMKVISDQLSAAPFQLGPLPTTMGVGELMSNAITLSVPAMSQQLPPQNNIPTSSILPSASSIASLVASQATSLANSLNSNGSGTNNNNNNTTTLSLTTPQIPGISDVINSAMIAEAVQQAIQLQLMQQTQSMDISNLLCLSRLIKPTNMYCNSSDEFLVRQLTQEENNMLADLMQVYHLSFTADLEPLVHVKHLDPSLDQLVNQSSITVLRIIKFAKRLEEFVKLSQECQIGILKGCWIHILLLRSVSVYDIVRDVWGTPRGDIPTAILKNATGYDQLHDDHINYCKSIKSIIRDDITIVVILIVIVLFSPEGPHVMTRELVSNIQDRYLVLLKHYLESKYTYVRAADMFPQLISKMKELKELAEVHGRVLLDVNPSEIEPIMLEILDLK